MKITRRTRLPPDGIGSQGSLRSAVMKHASTVLVSGVSSDPCHPCSRIDRSQCEEGLCLLNVVGLHGSGASCVFNKDTESCTAKFSQLEVIIFPHMLCRCTDKCCITAKVIIGSCIEYETEFLVSIATDMYALPNRCPLEWACFSRVTLPCCTRLIDVRTSSHTRAPVAAGHVRAVVARLWSSVQKRRQIPKPERLGARDAR